MQDDDYRLRVEEEEEMEVSKTKQYVLFFFGVVFIVGLVIISVIHQEQMKDDCQARGGIVTEVHGSNDNTWICAPPGSNSTIILDSSPANNYHHHTTTRRRNR